MRLKTAQRFISGKPLKCCITFRCIGLNEEQLCRFFEKRGRQTFTFYFLN